MIEVVEFIARLGQGYTEASMCRAIDGHLYVTKSVRAGRESLIREVIAGRVGQRLGVPVPPFTSLYTSPEIARQSLSSVLADLTPELPGFGSRFVHSVSTLSAFDTPSVTADLRRRVLLFDWWVLNEDRTDENPNLLWNPSSAELHVIDHNLSFDTDLLAGRATDAFWGRHLFRNDRPGLSDDHFRREALPVMDAIIREVPAWWAALPDGWTESASLTSDAVLAVLGRCRSDQFWAVLT